jgi:hypothetical protein
MAKQSFPIFWTVVLIFGLLWLGKETGFIPWGFDFPWLPIIVILFAVRGISKGN